MWISQEAFFRIYERHKEEKVALQSVTTAVEATNARLLVENARLRADLDWFKLRLNQVEKERGQLIQAALGVKVSVPEFVSAAEDPMRALQEMPDFAQIGQDAANEADYSSLPTRAFNNS